ncbi:internal scaffolding protein [robinz microvirus RP_110]|nr:internal scaffolding protein [robinz microvirus RP_110]
MAKRDPAWTGFYIEHEPVTANTEGESRTRQEFAAECDINTIMERYEATGIISHVDQRQPMYLDVSNVPDLQSALRVLDTATESFMSLPARVRLEFENDVHKFVAFAENGENLGRMREWGLAPPEAVADASMPGEVVNPASSSEPL